jgi:hypothetical protein
MPPEIEDRNADVWEALLMIADAAGDRWPERARAAAVELIGASKDQSQSLGVTLLADLARVFAEASTDQLPTQTILTALHSLDESPWADLRGKALDARGISRRLAGYGVKPVQIWVDGKNVRGYRSTDLLDPCRRYCTPDVAESLNGLALSPPFIR